MEPPPLLPTSTRIWGGLGLLVGVGILMAGVYFMGLLMLAFGSDSCRSTDRLDFVFLLWSGLCVLALLLPSGMLIWRGRWQPALLSLLGSLGLAAVGFGLSFALLIRVCA